MNLTYEENSSYKIKNAPQGSHCGGMENDTAYPAAGGEYAFTRILSCKIFLIRFVRELIVSVCCSMSKGL